LLQADVEIGRQQERHFALERMRQVAVARINTLVHVPPDLSLPPAPAEIKVEDGLPPAPILRETALNRRPDLRALASRVAADRASLGLARKEYCPDVELMAAYDTFWQEQQLRAQVGVKVNLPVRLARRDGAVSEAEARLAERQAELARRTDEVNFEVEQAYAQVHESARAVHLYEQTVLPAAEANVKSAQAAYVNGQIPFLTLVEAERNVVSLRDRNYELVADYYRRLATLERVVGGPVAGASTLAPCPAAAPSRP
jgi:outer membrane protein TolC